MPRDTDHLTLVYSCSGCSSAAHLARRLAAQLDRAGLAELSCIAGASGRVPSRLRRAEHAARTGRPMLAIDGCALACVRSALAQIGVQPTVHVQLGAHGVRKTWQADADDGRAEALYASLTDRVRAMNALHPPHPAGGCGGTGARRGAQSLEAP